MKLKRFSYQQQIHTETDRDGKRPVNSSLGERASAATKVIGTGTAIGAGLGYGALKGTQMYLKSKSSETNKEIMNSILTSPLKDVKSDVLKGAGKKAAFEGSNAIAGHYAKKVGKTALVAGGVGIGGALAQKYFKKQKELKNNGNTR